MRLFVMKNAKIMARGASFDLSGLPFSHECFSPVWRSSRTTYLDQTYNRAERLLPLRNTPVKRRYERSHQRRRTFQEVDGDKYRSSEPSVETGCSSPLRAFAEFRVQYVSAIVSDDVTLSECPCIDHITFYLCPATNRQNSLYFEVDDCLGFRRNSTVYEILAVRQTCRMLPYFP